MAALACLAAWEDASTCDEENIVWVDAHGKKVGTFEVAGLLLLLSHTADLTTNLALAVARCFARGAVDDCIPLGRRCTNE